MAPVVKLVQVLYLLITGAPRLAGSIAGMLFGWLRQLDEPDADVLILAGATPLRIDRRSMISELRAVSRSEERRVGKECVSTCRSRWSPDSEQKKHRTTIK